MCQAPSPLRIQPPHDGFMPYVFLFLLEFFGPLPLQHRLLYLRQYLVVMGLCEQTQLAAPLLRFALEASDELLRTKPSVTHVA